MAQEESPWRLKDDVSLNTREPFELGRDGVQDTGIERRALCDISGVERKERVEGRVGGARNVVLLEITANLSVGRDVECS